MAEQAQRAGCEIQTAEVAGIRTESGKVVVSTTGDDLVAPAAIVASGVQPRELGLPGEKELRGRGVSYCAICDGPLFKGKEVAVVGGGDSALDESLYLSGVCSRVHLIHRRDEFRAIQVTQDRVRACEKINLILSSTVGAINGKGRLETLSLTSTKDGSTNELPVSGLFIYIGSIPNTEWCRDALELDAGGFVKCDDRLATNMPGVFAAGDVRVTPLRQIVTAVADGALAAMSAHRHLTERG
jgi:thioredoxin reductase (NADPH)